MKKRLTRFLPFLLAFTIALPSYSVFAEEENQTKEPQTNETQANEATANDTLSLAAETAVLIDAASGEILYDKDADKKMYPASITKLMTILLALENGKLTDEITFSHDAVYNIEPGSAHIAILEGETLTLEQVLRAIILRSAAFGTGYPRSPRRPQRRAFPPPAGLPPWQDPTDGRFPAG